MMIAILSSLLLFQPVSSLQNNELKQLYAQARQVRALKGAGEATALYQDILRRNPHDKTAATRIAAEESSPERHRRLGHGGDRRQRIQFIKQLQSFNFHPDAIADLVFEHDLPLANKAKSSSAPLYLQPLRAGSSVPPLPTCPLGACIQLLLLACCLPLDVSHELLGNDTVELMEELGVAFVERDYNLLIPYCHLMPLTVRGGETATCIYTATDLHPNVLSTTTVGSETGKGKTDDAVMYIGPDSLSLVDHWCSFQQLTPGDTVLDIGCGSGIQAMSLVCSSKGATAKCADINPRALRITKLNFDWNSLEEPMLIQGDITEQVGRMFDLEKGSAQEEPKPWEELLGKATRIVSNPPFLPVPVHDSMISLRHGFFSSGGSDGERVLISVVRLASRVLKTTDDASLAIVSEFMNPQLNFGSRLTSWWGSGGLAKAVLFINQFPVSATQYASRRADSLEEAYRWESHLEEEGIECVSPGFLFLKRDIKGGHVTDATAVELTVVAVPRTDTGSVWTPGNTGAIEFTRRVVMDLWNSDAYQSSNMDPSP